MHLFFVYFLENLRLFFDDNWMKEENNFHMTKGQPHTVA